jgi:glycerol-3-phosphate acyltransferase PlsY
LAVTVAAYLLGSLSFAVIISRVMGLSDPRSYGSKNPGATNVLRTGNKLAAALTFLGDALKGYFAVMLARILLGDQSLTSTLSSWVLCGVVIAVFLGHLFPIFHGFKGGKGVATAAGSLLPLHPFLIIGAALTWLLVTKVTKKASIASIAIVPVLVVAFIMSGTPGWEILSLVGIGALVEIRHASNIKRLLSGTEPPVTGSTV